jgi:[protein-PII] uridylyltransferase
LKARLLRELFERTLTFIRRGADRLMAERAAVVKRRQREVARRLGPAEEIPKLAAIFAGLPDRYFAENSPARVAAHIRLLRERKGPCATLWTFDAARANADLVVIADDVPGLLAKVAGVLFANRIDIVSAAIYSRDPPAGAATGEAVDVFHVRPASVAGVIDDEKASSVGRDLEAVLGGRAEVEALVAARKPSGSPFVRGRPEVPATEVKVDNEVSRDFTVIDVFTEDKPGVLYTIAHTLSDLGLDIHRSKVGVEADRVADIFYVRDKGTRRKIADPGRLEQITRALREALPTSKREGG